MEKTALVLIALIAAGRESESLMMPCEADHECPTSYFCYFDTKYCSKCLDCLIVHRLNSTSRCTKNYRECGNCLPGFQEDMLTDGKHRDLCIPQPTEDDPHEVDRHNNPDLVLVIAMFLVIFIMMTLSVVTIIYLKKKYSVGSRQITHSEEPPPYSSLTPVITNNHSVVDEVNVVNESRNRRVEVASGSGGRPLINEESFSCDWVQSKEDSRLQEAVPFCLPTYCQNSNNSDDSGVSELDNESQESPASWNADLHDETTMPSEWTPGLISIRETQAAEEPGEGACNEEACDGDVYMNDQVEQHPIQHHPLQHVPSSRSPQSECN